MKIRSARSRIFTASAALLLLSLAAAGCRPGGDAPADLTDAKVRDTAATDAGLPFRAPCTEHAQCRSGLCLDSGICSKVCDNDSHCPPAPQWSCKAQGGSRLLCRCQSTGAEICNGQDDNCDGQVDDNVSCPPGKVCLQGACKCKPPAVLCDGKCVDLSRSLEHCGTCNNPCPSTGAPPHMAPSCRAGQCGFACQYGWGDCDGKAGNGCEQDLLKSGQHCGKCNNACQDFCAGGTCCDHPVVKKSCSNGWCTIPAGCFMMGSPTTEACRAKTAPWPHSTYVGFHEDQHPVRLTHSFIISELEVTQGQFKALMGYNPSYASSTDPKCLGCKCGLTQCYCGSSETCDKNPVDLHSWYEGAAYCNTLSQQAGLKPCYQCMGTGKTITCQEAPGYGLSGVYKCPGYRLPTEAEWEYAYRAGTKTAYYSGPNNPDPKVCLCNYGPSCGDDSNLSLIAWWSRNMGGTIHPGGLKQRNGWGLADMSGNLAEICHDWSGKYHVPLDGSAVMDPWGVDAAQAMGKARVGRGGGAPAGNRAASRGLAGLVIDHLGQTLRCVRSL